MDNLKIKIKQDTMTISNDLLNSVFNNVKKWIDTLPLFNELGFDLLPLLAHARQFRTYQDVIILGTGGSSLSGKMYSMFKTTSGPRMHFVDNVDSYEWNKLFSKIDIKTTGVIAISKSGNTTETLCQTLMSIEKWRGLPHLEHFLFIVDPGESALREIAEYYDITCLDHPIGIGGRFSGFSVVGLLPALISGIDAKEVLSGAQEIVKAFLDEGATPENSILNSAFLQNDLFLKGVNISILFCYAERLCPFAEWYRQLWSESLGKKEHYQTTDESCNDCKRYGTTPVVALGTVDQHSQLQLYVDGPKDKFFTILSVGDHPETDPIKLNGMTNPISRSLDGHTMAELINAHQQITFQTLLQNKNPVRSLYISKLDEKSLGQLMMFAILETLSLASLWNIDPFNQPGVKSGKDKVIALMRG